MSTTPPKGQHGGPRPKVRSDDARGKRAGEPGRGVQPFVASAEQRTKVRTLAKTMKHEQQAARQWIASQVGISVSTLDRHFLDDMVAGRAEVVASLGATLIGVALGTIKDISRERLDAIKYALARIGGWSTKLEMSGADGRPVEVIDLSGMTPASLREYGRQAAISQGLDPDEVVGPPLDDE